MKFLRWDISIRKRATNLALPKKYGEYENNKRLLLLPNESLSPTDYLQNLVNQMREDIYPLFRATKGGAPFTVTRNTLCYIDHIASLIYGPEGPQNVRLKKVISQLGLTDPYLNSNYQKYSDYLIQIYRHDLVHNIRPFPKKILVNVGGRSESRETWFFMQTLCDGKSFDHNLKYMSQKRSRKGRNHLRLADVQVVIDTFSLFFDTVILINSYVQKSKNDTRFEVKLSRNYYKIMRKSYFSLRNFTLDQSLNKQIFSKSR